MRKHTKELFHDGVALTAASRVMVMLHGRGGSARDILSVASYLKAPDVHFLAPQATDNTWYPFSFMSPIVQNQPWLDDALLLLDDILEDIFQAGVSSSCIYLLGFSQGACLSLEYAARKARVYGGVVAFSGGLIGEKIYSEHYQGDFGGTPVFIGNSDTDPHVPWQRSEASGSVFQELGAKLTLKSYPNMAHTINQDEIDWVKNLLAQNPV